MRYRQTWAFALGKFLTDPVWWLYLFWIPDFLNRNYGIDLTTIGPPLVAIYLIADVGSHRRRLAVVVADQARLDRQCRAQDGDAGVRAGGPADGVRLEGDRPVGGGRARRPRGGRAPGLVGESLHADLRHVPTQAVGSVVGLGGMAGAVGGMLIAKVTGYILETTGSYVPIFFIAAFAYLVALGCYPSAGAEAGAGETELNQEAGGRKVGGNAVLVGDTDCDRPRTARRVIVRCHRINSLASGIAVLE